MEILDCAVRMNNPVIQLEIRAFADALLNSADRAFSVPRMKASDPVFPNRDARSRIETKQAMMFLGGMDELSGRDVERPAACVAQPLRFP